MSVNQRCSLFRVSVNQRFNCMLSQNNFVFLIWWIVSEMELEKFRTILHIRGKNCLLVTRSHTKFHYIYEIPKTCLLLLNHLEMRWQKSWGLFIPSSQQPPNVAPAIFKNFQRYEEKLLSLSVSKFMFFLELRIACQLPVTRSLAFPIVLTTKKTLIVIKTIVNYYYLLFYYHY